VVVVPSGSQVTRLNATELDDGIRTASAAAFPLLAYRRFCDGVPLEEFGLAAPRLTIGVHRVDGRTASLLIGAANFTGGGTYVLEQGSPCVDLVTTSSVRALARLGGEASAAPFGPPPQATGPAGDAGRPEPDPAAPWVDQARREQARKGVPGTERKG
jgi:hypothetical protein